MNIRYGPNYLIRVENMRAIFKVLLTYLGWWLDSSDNPSLKYTHKKYPTATDYKWKIIDAEQANIEGASLVVDGGNGPDNYLCGNCAKMLAINVTKGIGAIIQSDSARWSKCNKINAIEWAT